VITAALDPRRARLALWGLVGASLADAVGATMILPVLPLFVHSHGASYSEIGLITAAYWGAGLVVGYPIGRLSDRLGRKRLLIGGQLIYAAATAGFALTPSPLLFLLLRAVQGGAAGAVLVLAMAAVADLVPQERRGRAYGSLTGANMGGTIIGPLIGTTLFSISVGLTFVASAVVAAVAGLILVFTLPGGRVATVAREAGRVPAAFWHHRAVIGILIAAISIGFLMGMYDTLWSLLMHARHASNFEIGLSFTVFALPFAVCSWPAGRLADHFDNRWLIGVSVVVSAAFAVIYPFLPSPGWLIGLGAFEGIFTVVGMPARQAMLSRQVHPEDMGKVQGVYGSLQLGASALAAIVAGSLFGVAIPLPFIVTAAAMMLSALSLPFIWRGVDGTPVHRPLPVAEPAPN
jgi:DHA1 family multidrug resistance protein-like MFS transporter